MSSRIQGFMTKTQSQGAPGAWIKSEFIGEGSGAKAIFLKKVIKNKIIQRKKHLLKFYQQWRQNFLLWKYLSKNVSFAVRGLARCEHRNEAMRVLILYVGVFCMKNPIFPPLKGFFIFCKEIMFNFVFSKRRNKTDDFRFFHGIWRQNWKSNSEIKKA